MTLNEALESLAAEGKSVVLYRISDGGNWFIMTAPGHVDFLLPTATKWRNVPGLQISYGKTPEKALAKQGKIT